jgi:hypothetical protein
MLQRSDNFAKPTDSLAVFVPQLLSYKNNANDSNPFRIKQNGQHTQLAHRATPDDVRLILHRHDCFYYFLSSFVSFLLFQFESARAYTQKRIFFSSRFDNAASFFQFYILMVESSKNAHLWKQ